MRALALPIRINPDGRLERTEPGEALLQVVQAMVASSAASWAHAPWFGLHELFLAANPAVRDQHRLAEALNRALGELGLTQVRVASVTARAADAPGERRFDITFVSEGEPPLYGSVTA